MARPVTDEDRERVRELHAAGRGRNEIAREIGRPAGTVTRIARVLGLSFNRSATRAATQARKTDLAARRTALIDRAYTRAEHIYDRLEADKSGYKFTATTVNGIETRTLDHVPGQEERALAVAAGSHLSHAAKLEAVDAGDGADAARSLVGQLATGLAAAYEAMQPASAEGDGDAP